jgi:hypothetical protein
MAEDKVEELKLEDFHGFDTKKLLDYYKNFVHEEGQKVISKFLRDAQEQTKSDIDSYFIERYGHDTKLSTETMVKPKKYIINPKDIFKEGREFINHLVLRHIERDLGKEIAKHYASNREMLESYAKSHLGIEYNKFLHELKKTGGNVEELLDDNKDSYLKQIIKSISANNRLHRHFASLNDEFILRSTDEKHNQEAREYLLENGVKKELAYKTNVADIANSTIFKRIANNQEITSLDYIKDATLFKDATAALEKANEAKSTYDIDSRIKGLEKATNYLPDYKKAA